MRSNSITGMVLASAAMAMSMSAPGSGQAVARYSETTKTLAPVASRKGKKKAARREQHATFIKQRNPRGEAHRGSNKLWRRLHRKWQMGMAGAH